MQHVSLCSPCVCVLLGICKKFAITISNHKVLEVCSHSYLIACLTGPIVKEMTVIRHHSDGTAPGDLNQPIGAEIVIPVDVEAAENLTETVKVGLQTCFATASCSLGLINMLIMHIDHNDHSVTTVTLWKKYGLVGMYGLHQCETVAIEKTMTFDFVLYVVSGLFV